ncbi:MAG: hypothetical protein J0H88_16285 [Sphingomonadales bacterium]|nr:hypothetical protein [Sphingomonadales bacterium]
MGSYPVLERLDHDGKAYGRGDTITIDDEDIAYDLQIVGAIGREGDPVIATVDGQPIGVITELTATLADGQFLVLDRLDHDGEAYAPGDIVTITDAIAAGELELAGVIGRVEAVGGADTDDGEPAEARSGPPPAAPSIAEDKPAAEREPAQSEAAATASAPAGNADAADASNDAGAAAPADAVVAEPGAAVTAPAAATIAEQGAGATAPAAAAPATAPTEAAPGASAPAKAAAPRKPRAASKPIATKL